MSIEDATTYPVICPGDGDGPHLWLNVDPENRGATILCPEHFVNARRPKLGEMVIYTLTEGDAQATNRRRGDAGESLDMHRRHRTGVIIHVGNIVREGDEFPMVITRVISDGTANGQVFLDGVDTLWVTSRKELDGPGTFRYM